MSRGQIISPEKFNKMNKKQKQSIKKNSFSLGFDPGFTKKMFDELQKSQHLQNIKRKNDRISVLNIFDEKKKSKVKKKKIDIKAKILKHKLKKKNKKSV
jgi:hypothetical protein